MNLLNIAYEEKRIFHHYIDIMRHVRCYNYRFESLFYLEEILIFVK